MNSKPPYNFEEGALLLVDKPLNWTSFDVVNKIRYALKKSLGVKKIKVGHAGTLDPLATGLLLICTGKFTKQIDSLQVMTKAYTGTIKLGATTPSYDAESEEDSSFPTDSLEVDALIEAAQSFVGDINQVPPVFSAIKVDGKPLYESARAGINVELKARAVSIYDFDLTRIEIPEVDFFVTCSKGTYIRSLAHDFGKALDNGGYLISLRRTKIGDYDIKDAWNLEALIKYIMEGE